VPRPRKPARLWQRPDNGAWIIRDGHVQVRTGHGIGERGAAEEALADYLRSRKPPDRRGPAAPAELTVGEVLARYVDDKGSTLTGAGPATLANSVAALVPYFGNLTCDSVKGTTCRAYTRERATPREVTIKTRNGKTLVRTHSAGPGTVRRELGVLQAALNHAHEEGLLVHPIKVSLPDAGVPRDRWLTRSEAAKLLRAAAPHVRRFILISLYTGRRATAVLDLTWTRVDLDQGVIRFRAEGQAETNKRRGRVRIPRQLAAHLRRWHRDRAGTQVVEFRGERLDSIKTGIRRAAERAGLEGVTPHVLKHTAITWAVMDPRLSIEGAAEYFDTSPATIRRTYWHHSPHHQEEGLAAVERRR
jgi:integrase